MAKLIAKTNGTSYSLFLESENKWRTITDKSSKGYVPPKNYVPLHKRNLRRSCKLFLSIHWQAYGKVQKEFEALRTI